MLVVGRAGPSGDTSDLEVVVPELNRVLISGAEHSMVFYSL